jgi:hypothetical protein
MAVRARARFVSAFRFFVLFSWFFDASAVPYWSVFFVSTPGRRGDAA